MLPFLASFDFFQQAQTGSEFAKPHTAAMDMFVMINLAFLMFMLGFFACWAWLIWRRTTQPAPHMKLIMELEEELAQEKKNATMRDGTPEGTPEPRAGWEREADWWRK
jgi:hypothetical protein